MKRVLVTGATGCLGRHVVPTLVAGGWDVHAVQSHQAPFACEGVTWHRANLLDATDRLAVVRSAGATHLLHLAWYVAPRTWPSAPENFEWVEASLGLLRAFAADGGTRVVTAGSVLEYDWNYGYCSEERTPCTPHTIYGTCKHALSDLTEAFARTNGITSAWGRPFIFYGPHEHPDRLVASVIRSLLQGEPARCSHGNQIRDVLFVQDVADAFVALLQSDVTGAINIASGRPIALKDIITRIGTMIGRPDLIRLGAIPQAPTDKPFVVADVTRLSATLEWRPRFDLETGLAASIDWWRAATQQAAAVESTA